MCSEFQVRYYLSTSSVSLICCNLLANKMLADLVFFNKPWFKLIQQHFSCYCHAILGTASICSYLLCFAQNESATIAPWPPCRNGILEGACWTIITLVLLPHLVLHCTVLDIGITHSTAEIGSILPKGQSPKDMSKYNLTAKIGSIEQSTKHSEGQELWSQLEIELSSLY
jgi:hypothetical protein